MTAFVEFGHEKNYTKSSFHTKLKVGLKMLTYGACFRFIGPLSHKALTVKLGEKVKEKLFCSSLRILLTLKQYMVMLKTADQGRFDIYVVFTRILCGLNFCVW